MAMYHQFSNHATSKKEKQQNILLPWHTKARLLLCTHNSHFNTISSVGGQSNLLSLNDIGVIQYRTIYANCQSVIDILCSHMQFHICIRSTTGPTPRQYTKAVFDKDG